MNMIWKSGLNTNRVTPKEEEMIGDSLGNRGYEKVRKVATMGNEGHRKLSSYYFGRIGREMMLGESQA